jgi:hypothetical protein
VDPPDVDASDVMVIVWYGGGGAADEKSKLTMRSLPVPIGIRVAVVTGVIVTVASTWAVSLVSIKSAAPDVV